MANAIAIDLTNVKVDDRINKFVAIEGSTITVEFNIEISYLKYLVKEGKVILTPDNKGYSWVPKAK